MEKYIGTRPHLIWVTECWLWDLSAEATLSSRDPGLAGSGGMDRQAVGLPSATTALGGCVSLQRVLTCERLYSGPHYAFQDPRACLKPRIVPDPIDTVFFPL